MSLLRFNEFNHLSTWKRCSYDKANDIYMLENEERTINFDEVKTRYLNHLGKSEECASSVDALGEDGNGFVYLVEFKNGQISKEEIRKKVTDSLLIYGDVTNSGIRKTRENVVFILVYNPEEINLSPVEERAIHLARLGKTGCPKYDLDKLQSFCVSNAYMMTAKYFEKKMIPRFAM